MNVFMFPGQGSQKRGMGQGLFDEVPQFAAVESQVDALLGYSLRALCLEDAHQQLSQTQFTQPCLYVVNALHHDQALADGLRPDVLVGHSLGEYNALLAAGAFDLLTGLRMVQKRGELMAKARQGGMLAVVGLRSASILDVVGEQGLSGIDVANFNAPAQTVISGPSDELARAVQPLEAAGATMVVPLAVSAAFHSRYMFEASQAYGEFLAQCEFKPLQRTVVANVTGRPYPADASAQVISAYLVKQMAHPVQWVRSMNYLVEQSAREFHEIGPGQVLKRLIAQIHPGAITPARPAVAQALRQAPRSASAPA